VGRYTINLIDELAKLDKKNFYSVLLKRKYFNQLKFPEKWKKVLADFRHYTFTEQLQLPRLVSEQKPDIVHFLHFNIPVFYSGKFIVTVHDLTMHRQGTSATTLPLPIYYFKRLPYKYAFWKAVKSSVKIIVPSKTVKDEVVNYYAIDERKVKVVYEGLGDKFKEEEFTGNVSKVLKKYKLEVQKYFVYVGNVYPHKNLGRAIEAVVEINRNSDRRILFAIASSRNIFTERLERMIKNLQAGKYVRLLGFVSDEDLGILLKNSTALVYPSLSEGFGLQGLESIAAGTLVLASDISVFKEVYKDNVLYFNPFDFTSIEKTMREALEMSPRQREKFIKKGQKFIQRYSWSKMAKQTLKVYKEARTSSPRVRRGFHL
jgi:glycosyltransferase involved in cell wall biosynthesis